MYSFCLRIVANSSIYPSLQFLNFSCFFSCNSQRLRICMHAVCDCVRSNWPQDRPKSWSQASIIIAIVHCLDTVEKKVIVGCSFASQQDRTIPDGSHSAPPITRVESTVGLRRRVFSWVLTVLKNVFAACMHVRGTVQKQYWRRWDKLGPYVYHKSFCVFSSNDICFQVDDF